MVLQDIFNQLTVGEFSQLGLVKKGIIEQEDYHKVIHHLNLGLQDLYTRFNIKQGELTVDLREDKALYLLHSDYAVSKNPTDDSYILDAERPFTDDILLITDVYDDLGEKVSLNSLGNTDGVSTPTFNQLQVSEDVLANADLIYVGYKAQHPVLDPQLTVPSTTQIELPMMYLNALLCYVASRVHMIRLKEGSAQLAAGYQQKYELECQRLDQAGLTNRESAADRNTELFQDGGWA